MLVYLTFLVTKQDKFIEMKQEFKYLRTVYVTTAWYFCLKLPVRSFISSEINKLTLPKLGKISFVLKFLSLQPVHERIPTPKKSLQCTFVRREKFLIK